MEAGSTPRVAAILVGDIRREPGPRIKYGGLLTALGARLPLVGVGDASLRGLLRLWMAARTFRPDRGRWRELFHKNTAAFRHRSRKASRLIEAVIGRVDVVLQVGGMLDARWHDSQPPSVIYTDYTALLSARRPQVGRSPLSGRELDAWLRLETRAYRRAAHVCARSEFVRRSLISDYDLPAEGVTTIGAGVNFTPLPALEPRRSDAPPTALFVGVELFRKGGDVLLKAFARARARVADAKLIMVTGERVPPGLPLEGVTVLEPTWDRSRLAALYASADLFVLPSRLETWGDVLLEAMAYGLPCIGVEGEAMAEIVDAGTTGLLVPPAQEAPLADALVELFENPDRRARWGRAARRRVESEFTWERVADRLAARLETAAAPAAAI